MTYSRRTFLQSGLAVTALGGMPGIAGATGADHQIMTAQKAAVQLAPSSYPMTEIWGYDGKMPGPAIRVAQGGRVQRRLMNDLPQATSVHWHGVRIANAMDGVSGLTQEAVKPGGGFDYDFVAPDAGTYWFHAHNRSVEQVARGLYGALIVEEPDAPDVDRDEVLVLDDWLLNPDTAQIDPNFESMHDRSHAGRRGNFVATNGVYGFGLDVAKGERLRLRLINAANARIFMLDLSGLDGWIMAHDGMPLPTPQKIAQPIFLAPGQRADLFVDVTADVGDSAHLVRIEDQNGYAQAEFRVTGVRIGEKRTSPIPLPPNPNMDVPGLTQAKRIRLNMEGGAMGNLQAAVLNGQRQSFRQLASANQFWAFNGTVGLTDEPLAQLSQGQTVRLEIYNDTSFPHAMHLHGMHFREVQTGDQLGPLRDTLLMFSGETHEIAFVADNPGKWLFHCHMLSHAAAGMMTWLEVA